MNISLGLVEDEWQTVRPLATWTADEQTPVQQGLMAERRIHGQEQMVAMDMASLALEPPWIRPRKKLISTPLWPFLNQ
ncbi:hypothetical protein P7K49_028051, partial [Saguinus oedipus]